MEIAERFARRFHGLTRAHGVYTIDKRKKKGNKIGGRARTLKEPVTLEKWQAHLDGDCGLGIVPITDDNTSLFGAIDIDIYDGLNLEALERNVRKGDFPLVTCRTKSGGAHLYLFLTEWAPSGMIKDALMEWAIALGYPGSEVFPKQSELRGEDDVGNWINMPYFGGDETTRYAIYDGESLTLKEFIAHVDDHAVPMERITSFEIKQDKRLSDGPPCLQHLSQAGFPEGTRNKALFNLGVLCREKYGDDWKKHLDEFNRAYLTPPLSSAEVKTISGSLSKKKYFYTCKEAPIVNACNRVACVKRKYGIGGSSHDLGVVLDCLIKVLTDPPTWVINVDGKRVSLPTTPDLMDQGRFIQRSMDALNVLPQRVSRVVWDDMIRSLLDKVEEIEAPDDAGTLGQFLFLVEQFCSERVPARDPEELVMGKPFTEKDGITYFRSTDMLSYLDKHKLRVTAQEAWTMLRGQHAKPKRYKIKGKTVRCWGLPEPEHQTESFDVPDVKDEDEDF